MTTAFSASRCLAPKPVRSSPWCKRRCWQPCPMPGSATPFSRTRRWRRDSARSSRRCRLGPYKTERLSHETRTCWRVQPSQCSAYGVALGSDRITGLAVGMSAGHWLDRADEVYGIRGEREPTAGGAQSLVELDVWLAHRRTVLKRAGKGGGDDRSVDRTATLVGEGLSKINADNIKALELYHSIGWNLDISFACHSGESQRYMFRSDPI